MDAKKLYILGLLGKHRADNCGQVVIVTSNPAYLMDETFELNGLGSMYPMSDDDCCKLLAWLLVLGGGDESVVYNTVLNCRILKAQKRLNIGGGCMPNMKLLPLLSKRTKELETGTDDWCDEMCKNYKINLRR